MNNKLSTIINLFEGHEIRSVWNKDKEEYFFSVIDVIEVLTDATVPKRYWSDLKHNLTNEGSQLYENIVRLKMKAKDGKMRSTDTLDTQGIFRLIESIPSPKAEPFKIWLANLGKERIDEIFDPEKAINRAIDYYRKKGYNDRWILDRLTGILNRKKLTDTWQENGINKNYEYAMLTNEIYKSWSGMKASDYKSFKGLRKESLRDNMTDIEIALTNIGEIAARDIAKEEKPKGLKNNLNVAKRGGNVAKNAKDAYEKETKKSAISKNNKLNYKYIDERAIEEKEIKMTNKILEKMCKDIDINKYSQDKQCITFVAGPGFGKTTITKKILKKTNFFHCSNDYIARQIESFGYDISDYEKRNELVSSIAFPFQDYLFQNNIDFVLDANLMLYLDVIKKRCENYGYKLYVIELKINPEEALRRSLKRLKSNDIDNLSNSDEKDFNLYLRQYEEYKKQENKDNIFFTIDMEKDNVEQKVDELLKIIHG